MDNKLLENDDLIEFGLLDKNFIARFDLIKTEANVMEIMSDFLKAQYKFTGILPPRLTTNYNIRYESFSLPNYSDTVGNYVVKKLDSKDKIIQFYNVLAGTLMRMNLDEKVYYTEHLLNGKSERSTAETIGVSRNGILPIKNSCLVKIALAFGKEVEK